MFKDWASTYYLKLEELGLLNFLSGPIMALGHPPLLLGAHVGQEEGSHVVYAGTIRMLF